MSSDNRKRANRENAKKSTGPRTPEGKARAKMNALKHGLAGKLVVINEEEAEEYPIFEQRMLERLKPTNQEELDLVKKIITCTWRLERVPNLEAQILSHYCKMNGPNAAVNLMRNDKFKEFLAISGHESRIDGVLRRAKRDLKSLRNGDSKSETANHSKQIQLETYVATSTAEPTETPRTMDLTDEPQARQDLSADITETTSDQRHEPAHIFVNSKPPAEPDPDSSGAPKEQELAAQNSEPITAIKLRSPNNPAEHSEPAPPAEAALLAASNQDPTEPSVEALRAISMEPTACPGSTKDAIESESSTKSVGPHNRPGSIEEPTEPDNPKQQTAQPDPKQSIDIPAPTAELAEPQPLGASAVTRLERSEIPSIGNPSLSPEALEALKKLRRLQKDQMEAANLKNQRERKQKLYVYAKQIARMVHLTTHLIPASLIPYQPEEDPKPIDTS